jgi:hypothetical protein
VTGPNGIGAVIEADSDFLHYAAAYHQPLPDGWFRVISQVDPVGAIAGLCLDILPVDLAELPTAPDDPGDLVADVDAGGLRSFKCRAYDDRPHDPCSGTTDDGTGRRCGCWCHTAPLG